MILGFVALAVMRIAFVLGLVLQQMPGVGGHPGDGRYDRRRAAGQSE
jgi:hypothetical protein